MLLPLMPHQEAMVSFAIKNSYCIVAAEMGVGKTPTVLAVWERMGGRLLIVCPSYLTINWHSEIRKFLGEGPNVLVIKKGKDILPKWSKKLDIAIISYDLAQKAESLFEWATMVVADEAHELKSMKAKRTEFFHRVIFENSIKRLHLLTGTPIKNRVEEYYSLIALCNYRPALKDSLFLARFPDSILFADHFSHRRQYTIQIRNRYVTVVKWEGVRNVEELRSYLKGIYIRYKSSDVLTLPPITYKDVLVSDLPDKALEKAFLAFYDDKANQAVDPTAKALAALKTVPFTTQYVKGLLEEIPHALVYTDHVDACLKLGEALGWPAITGLMLPEKRMKLAEQFQKGELKGLVATIASFSTGVNLTRAADIIVNDPSWVPGSNSQMEFRILRLGQKKHCTVHRIHGSPQATKIQRALDQKMKVIAQVT